MTNQNGEYDTFLELANRSLTEPVVKRANEKAYQYNIDFADKGTILDKPSRTHIFQELDDEVSELLDIDAQLSGTIFYEDIEGVFHTMQLRHVSARFRGYRFVMTPENGVQRLGYGFEVDPANLEGTFDTDDDETRNTLVDVSSELNVSMNFVVMSGLRAEALLQIYMPGMLLELNEILDTEELTHSEKLLALSTATIPKGIDFNFEQYRIAIEAFISWKLPVDRGAPYIIHANGIAFELSNDSVQPMILDDSIQLVYVDGISFEKDLSDSYCLQLDTRLIAPRQDEEERKVRIPVTTMHLVLSVREQTYRDYLH